MRRFIPHRPPGPGAVLAHSKPFYVVNSFKKKGGKEDKMGYYPTTGVISTIDGGLYACNEELREYLDEKWITDQAVKVECRFENGCTLLVMRSEVRRTAFWVRDSVIMKSVLSNLERIQSAVRDWLHQRKLFPRHEAALFLMANLPRDVVGLVVLALR
jgi:hypothetical protein